MAIALQGGIEPSKQPLMALGFASPFALLPLMPLLRLSGADSAAPAAPCGSARVVTFAVATAARAHGVLLDKSVLLLLGGLVIGAVACVEGTATIEVVSSDPFGGPRALLA